MRTGMTTLRMPSGFAALYSFGLVALMFLVASSVYADEIQIGSILACYSCQGTGDPFIDAALTANPSVASDGLLFAFKNTSVFDITGAVISVGGTSPADSFALGTVAADSEVILMPGLSDDGGSHPLGGLFAYVGYTMDTSDGQGAVNDSSIFSFTGTSNALLVTSLTAGSDAADGTFIPGDPGLILPWRNPTDGSTSFVGDGPDGDPGCSNCYFGEVATLDVPGSGTPEPQGFVLMLGGLGLVGWTLVRRTAAGGVRSTTLPE